VPAINKIKSSSKNKSFGDGEVSILKIESNKTAFLKDKQIFKLE
jgi:hypothetical protein